MDEREQNPQSLLEQIVSSDPAAHTDAWAFLADELVDYAGAQTGHCNHVKAQAISVVQSAIKDFLGEMPRVEKDAHLIGHLKLRVKNKIRQRLDARLAENKVQRLTPDAVRRDVGNADAAAREQEITLLRSNIVLAITETLGDRLSATDYALLRARVVSKRTWAEISAEFGVEQGALRTRWSRLQSRLKVILEEISDIENI